MVFVLAHGNVNVALGRGLENEIDCPEVIVPDQIKVPIVVGPEAIPTCTA
jgi:hypothetical protein